jgi:AraC-like DNA-binding protein
VTVRFRGELERELERCGYLAKAASSPVLPRTARIWFLQYRFAGVVESGDGLALGAWAADLVRVFAVPWNGNCRERYVPPARHAAAVETVRRRLVAGFAETHSLSSLASAARLSPFHFTRVFHALVGTPPHRFLREQRLLRALEMLRDGEQVTTTCYAVGFGNLSHFIRSFRDRFGFVPSRARKNPQAAGPCRL